MRRSAATVLRSARLESEGVSGIEMVPRGPRTFR